MFYTLVTCLTKKKKDKRKTTHEVTAFIWRNMHSPATDKV